MVRREWERGLQPSARPSRNRGLRVVGHGRICQPPRINPALLTWSAVEEAEGCLGRRAKDKERRERTKEGELRESLITGNCFRSHMIRCTPNCPGAGNHLVCIRQNKIRKEENNL